MVKWEVKNNTVIVRDLTHFDPVQTFECGQCFRWTCIQKNRWFGVVRGRVLELEWNGRDLLLYNTTQEEFLDLWYPYLDLDRDYGAIEEILSQNDPVMARAIAFGRGIRLLKQDFTEMLITFLISQNNGIPRIRQIIESLSQNFGEPIHAETGAYSFPSMERLAGLSLDELKVIRAGYRDKYIHRVAQQLHHQEVNLSIILKDTESKARDELLKLYGVGEKVADCVLLFSGIRYDIFPIDRWVKRVMAELYLGYEASYQELAAFARERFGELAGFAQEYLFYYARAQKIGIAR
jgi:N-glycosylase/DNA lyase